MLSELSYEEPYIMLKVVNTVKIRNSGCPYPVFSEILSFLQLLMDFRIRASPLHLWKSKAHLLWYSCFKLTSAANFNTLSFKKNSDFLAFISACSKDFGDITVCCQTAAVHSKHVWNDHHTVFHTNLLGLHSILGSHRWKCLYRG